MKPESLSGAPTILVVSSENALAGDTRYLAEARTGADGAFTVPDAPEGARVIIARAQDFIPANRIQIEARPEEKISLQRGGAVRGVVTDPAGKPAPGVIVTTDDAAAQTDAQGKFRLAGLPAGGLHLQALSKSDLAARKDGVRVRKGEEAEADLKLRPGTAVSGTVIEEGTRHPVAGARVSAYAAAGFARFARRRAERATRTDARGRFRLAGLAPSRYTIEAARDGYLTASIAGVNAAAQSAPPANLALRKAASISGRVTDEKGQPVAAARVRIVREMGSAGSCAARRPIPLRSWEERESRRLRTARSASGAWSPSAICLWRRQRRAMRRRARRASRSRRGIPSKTLFWSCGGGSKPAERS